MFHCQPSEVGEEKQMLLCRPKLDRKGSHVRPAAKESHVLTAGVLPLGNQPWLLLGIVTVVGNALIWRGSERVLGTDARRVCRR